MTTNSLNNEVLNDFTVYGASGGTRKVRIENTNNTASSNAISEIYVEGTSSGDPFCRHVIGTSHSYALGIDNSDSDKWKLTHSSDQNATPSSSDVILSVDTSGRWRRPMTPLFDAYVGTNIGSVQTQTIIFDQEVFDQGSNYDTSNGRFTCPVDGTYLLISSVHHSGVAATNNNGSLAIYHSGSSANQSQLYYNPTNCKDAGSNFGLCITCVYEASASDYFTVIVANDTVGGSDTTTVMADLSRFSGYLLG